MNNLTLGNYVQWLVWLSWLIFFGAIWRANRVGRRTETVHLYKTFILLLIYYLSYLIFPWILIKALYFSAGKISAFDFANYGLLAGIFIYARFIEPALLVVKQTHYRLDAAQPLKKPIRFVLLADIHIGLYSGHTWQLSRIVNKINHINPDFVVVSGDWTYEPERRLVEDLTVLKQIRCPVYSVNGNHDEQHPGPPVHDLLARALAQNEVLHIENKVIELGEVRLLGVGDLWAGQTHLEQLNDLPQDQPWLIVAHNPDSVALVPKLKYRPLMLSGHTHGGQIEIPWLTSYVMKKVSMLGYKKGLYQHENADVFVTVGTGLVGAPLRFAVPPTIDIITVQ